MSTCSSTSIQSFPVGLSSIVPTAELYTSVLQPLLFDFEWGTRTTNPQFEDGQNGMINEPNRSILRYNGLSYDLESVQITSPTHQTWITSRSSSTNNQEDIILTFSYTNLGSNRSEYIIIVVPILRVPETTNSPYFNAFATPNPPSQISISSVIPSGSSTLFAVYSTCFNGTGLGTPNQNVLNIIAVNGLNVTDLTMVRIKASFTQLQSGGTVRPYSGYVAPLGLSISTQLRTISTDSDFRLRVTVTKNILVPPRRDESNNGDPREETVDAYKCVPFDPDKQMINGKIRVDPNTGTPLNIVESQRNELKNSIVTNMTISTEVYSKYVSTALAFFFTAIVVVVVIYFFIGAAIGPSMVGHGGGFFNRLFKNLTNVPAYSVIGMLCGFIGFMMGMLLKHRQ